MISDSDTAPPPEETVQLATTMSSEQDAEEGLFQNCMRRLDACTNELEQLRKESADRTAPKPAGVGGSENCAPIEIQG